MTVLGVAPDGIRDLAERHGGHVTDAVLATVGAVLAEEARSYDTVARVGAGEFLVVCPTTDGDGGRALAERVLAAVPAACEGLLPDGARQTVSIGVAAVTPDDDVAARLLHRAGEALEAAGAGGGDRVEVAP